MPVPRIAASSATAAPLAGNALLSFVPADKFVVPASLHALVCAAKCVRAFQEDHNKCARMLEEVLQFAIAQKKGVRRSRKHSHSLGRSSLLHQSRSEEMSLAIANFEEQVWLGVFLPKWERIVARIISRPKVKAERQKKDAAAGVTQESAGAAAAAASAASQSAPAPLSALVISSGAWDTSTKGSFTSEAKSLLTRWFVDHITDPYPSDHEKHELARAARLSYDQVSAWFIGTRARKWVSWIRELQAGTMKQSPSVAAASAARLDPRAEAQYKLKCIEVMRGQRAQLSLPAAALVGALSDPLLVMSMGDSMPAMDSAASAAAAGGDGATVGAGVAAVSAASSSALTAPTAMPIQDLRTMQSQTPSDLSMSDALLSSFSPPLPVDVGVASKDCSSDGADAEEKAEDEWEMVDENDEEEEEEEIEEDSDAVVTDEEADPVSIARPAGIQLPGRTIFR